MNLYNPCSVICNILAGCCQSKSRYLHSEMHARMDSAVNFIEMKAHKHVSIPRNEIAVEERLTSSLDFDEILRWYKRGKRKMDELMRIEVLHEKVVTLELYLKELRQFTTAENRRIQQTVVLRLPTLLDHYNAVMIDPESDHGSNEEEAL